MDGPDGAFVLLKGVDFRVVAEDGAFVEAHFLVDEGPALRAPVGGGVASQGGVEGRRGVDRRADVLKDRIEVGHDLAEVAFALEVAGAEDVGEVVVRVARVEGGDHVGEGASAGELRQGPKGARGGKQLHAGRCCEHLRAVRR